VAASGLLLLATTTRGTPLLEGLGNHAWPITTSSPNAQLRFNQGLTLLYAFNHDEAIRSFEAALEEDPDCAMAWWGIAIANGPHINNPGMDPAASKSAWEALQLARRHAPHAAPLEQALIEALRARYADPAPEDRGPLDEAYADAMRKVWVAFPEDDDVAVLFAESMMDLRPWDLWTPDGKRQPGTDEIVATLERALELNPDHPGANHLYVHTMEASPKPERALRSADRLRTLVPGAGHLVHMPAHIYCRVGKWADAAEANVRAMEADRLYRAASPDQGFYQIYMAHNPHFLAWTAMMEGRSAVALEAARAMLAGVPESFARENAFFVDGYMTIALEVMKRFGRWNDILNEPEPPEYLPITRAHRRFSRALALAALGRVDEAKVEREAFLAALPAVGADAIVGNNSALQVLSIARHLLEGEIAYREKRLDDAVASLTEAVRLEDELRYNEAPDWLQPVRHTLGGVLLEAGRPKEAEVVYRADLERNRENGWALFGLARSLRARKSNRAAAEAEARFAKAWERADTPIQATCFCLSGSTASR
jgi:tetratricopeptide (TPR) repeat protein